MNPDALLTCNQAATITGVHPKTILTWRTRGYLNAGQRQQLPIASHDQAGNPLYLLRDLWAAERATRRNHRSHRQPQPALITT